MANGVLRHDFSSGNQQMWQFLRDVQDKKALRKLKEQQGLATAAYRERQEKRDQEKLGIQKEGVIVRQENLELSKKKFELQQDKNQRDIDKQKLESQKTKLEIRKNRREDENQAVKKDTERWLAQGNSEDELRESYLTGTRRYDNESGKIISSDHPRFKTASLVSTETVDQHNARQVERLRKGLVAITTAGGGPEIKKKITGWLSRLTGDKNTKVHQVGKDIHVEITVGSLKKGGLRTLLEVGDDKMKLSAVQIMEKRYTDDNVPNDQIVRVTVPTMIDREGNVSMGSPFFHDPNTKISKFEFAKRFPLSAKYFAKNEKKNPYIKETIKGRLTDFDSLTKLVGEHLKRVKKHVPLSKPGSSGEQQTFRQSAQATGLRFSNDEVEGWVRYSDIPQGSAHQIYETLRTLVGTANEITGYYENHDLKDFKKMIGNYYKRAQDAIDKYEWYLDRLEEQKKDDEVVSPTASEMRENLVGGPGLPNVNVPPGNVPAHIREGLRQSFGDGPKDSPTIEEERRKRRGVFKFRTN